MQQLATQLLFLCLLFVPWISVKATTLSPAEASWIGSRLFENECSQKKERLVWWNQGEQFASLGIGHCIWYPEGQRGPFEETFPLLLVFLKKRQIPVPAWLDQAQHCPWKNRETFLDPQNREIHLQLQTLLMDTLSLQAQFLYERFETALEKIRASLSEEERMSINQKIRCLEASALGKFALIDYFNFKGDGTSTQENYQGVYWGLKQVLQQMPLDLTHPLPAFIKAAKLILEQRVKKAPAERQEQKWLPGWIARVERYTAAN